MRATIYKPFLFFILHFSFFIFLVSCGGDSNKSNSTSQAEVATSSEAAGKKIYQQTCIACHQPDGKGLQGTYPPLANSDYLLADKFRAIKQVIKGSSGKKTVNGVTYQGLMPPQSLNDSDVALVLNYVYHSFGNNGFTVSPKEVKTIRDTAK